MRSDRPMVEGMRIRKLVAEDIGAVRELARTVWADQLFKDTGIEVEYPARERKVYEAYLTAEPEGNFVAEVDGEVVGAAYAHSWGSVGWTGPLEVDGRWHGKGIGRALMQEAAAYLERSGCNVVGVETMGDNDRNVGFYSSLGYSISSPTFVYEKSRLTSSGLTDDLEKVDSETIGEILSSIKALSGSIYPDLDLRKEFSMAVHGGLGKVLVSRDKADGSRINGAAIIHERTVEGLTSHLLRALIVDPSIDERERAFVSLLNGSETLATEMGASKIFFTSSVTDGSVRSLAGLGYKVIGNNVRMLRSGRYFENGDFQLISWAG